MAIVIPNGWLMVLPYDYSMVMFIMINSKELLVILDIHILLMDNPCIIGYTYDSRIMVVTNTTDINGGSQQCSNGELHSQNGTP